MEKKSAPDKRKNRRLGDEWVDWDGRNESTEADHRVFLGLAILSTILLIVAAGLFLWLIYPRLAATGHLLPQLFSVLFLVFSGILLLWLILFLIAAIARRPMTRIIIIPQMINRLLSLVMATGKILGISQDRLTNSFMKVNNLIIGSRPPRTTSEKLLVLLPRCLSKENNIRLREFRDNYKFQMATVGGGSEARLKIKEIRPRVIIAVACERDLLTGFRDVNTHIPVIGFPNKRPEGPCRNTCVDLTEIEAVIKNCLIENGH